MSSIKICPDCRTEFTTGEIFCPNDGARLSSGSQPLIAPNAPTDPLVGVLLDGRYRVVRRIGEGGMGWVYEAQHIKLEKRVAIKVLRDEYSGKPEVVERFKQEAKSASRIGSENIVDISDFGETDRGANYFVMEFLDGQDLANVLARDRVVPIHRASDIIQQCCKALDAAHAKGIVHRDMKPENIFLVTRDGRPDFVKIVDFGIAKMSDIETAGAPGRKLTKTGMIFGTPEYMSPEQAAGKEMDHRVDVYALGIILYEMLAGRTPFVGDSFMGVLTQHLFDEPPAIESLNPEIQISDSIRAFILTALEKEPERRFQSCAEMSQALDAALQGEAPRGHTRLGFAPDAKAKIATSPRIQTATQSEEFSPPTQPKPAMSVWIASAFLLALTAFIIIVATRSATETAVAIEPLTLIEPVATEVHDAAVLATSIEDVGPIIPVIETAAVYIQTIGEDAVITVDGHDTLGCDHTPCDITLAAGLEYRFVATHGPKHGSVTYLVRPGNNTVQIELRRPARAIPAFIPGQIQELHPTNAPD